MSDPLTICIISDLHCKHGGNQDLHQLQTFLTTDLDLLPVNRHPVEALKKRITEDSITADILLCPGDITDRIDKSGLFAGWRYLNDIKSHLKAKQLFATCGNHDVDSRKSHPNPTPFSIVQQLESQGYPTDNKPYNLKYWAKGYCVIELESSYILNFNSCYTHLNADGASKALIGQELIDEISEDLEALKLSKSKFKIGFLHHHPDHHSNFDLKFKDSDFLENGDKFLAMLEKHGFNIVIHGHKHEPKLRYYNRLPLFASGSFSSMMNIIDISAQNTFHIITLQPGGKKGIVRSWSYGTTKGWNQQEGSYFPIITGFGSTMPVQEIASKCNMIFSSQDQPLISYENVVSQIPEIAYLIPQEQSELELLLVSDFGLSFLPALPNGPKILIKQY